MNLFYVFSPEARQQEQTETKNFIKQIENLNLVDIFYNNTNKKPYLDILDFAFSLHEPFILLEQDIVPTIEQLKELIKSQHPISCYNYLLPSGHYSCRNYDYITRMNGNEVFGNPIFADKENFFSFYGFGFTKFNFPICTFNFKEIIQNVLSIKDTFLYSLYSNDEFYKNENNIWHILDSMFYKNENNIWHILDSMVYKNENNIWHILDSIFSYYTFRKGYQAKVLGVVKHNHK